MKAIVISYSLRHYTPGIPIREGIGNVAKTLHEAIIASFPEHNVIYTDPTQMDEIVIDQDVDWLFTVPRDMHKARKKFRPKKTVLFTANESAQSRFNILQYAKKQRVSRKLIGGHDGIYEDYREHTADFVIALGGWNSYSSFLRSGCPHQRVITTGIRYQNGLNTVRRYESKDYVVWFMGLICIRKGINELPAVLDIIDNHKSHKKLRLIGFTESKSMRDFIETSFKNSAPGHQWIDKKIYFGTNDWDKLHENVLFGIFPSREEGLPGCVIDLINQNVPVIYSSRCGFEFVTKQLSYIDFLDTSWTNRLPQFLDLRESEWTEISDLQAESAFFSAQDNQIERIVTRLSKGCLWPISSLERNEDFEYEVGQSEIETLDLIINYRGPELGKELSAKLLILELERYQKFRSAGIVRVDDILGKNVISVHRSHFSSHENPAQVEMFVVDEEETLERFSLKSRMHKFIHFYIHRFKILAKAIANRGE